MDASLGILSASWTFDLGAMTGAIIGAIVTVAGSVWVARRLDTKADNRKLLTAMRLVGNELEENARRIKRNEPNDHLTYGDWATNKDTLSELLLRPDTEAGWYELVKTYGPIYEAAKGRADLPPHLEADVDRTYQRLRDVQRYLEYKLRGFWLLYRYRKWRAARQARPV